MDPSKTSAEAEGAEEYEVTAAALCVHWVRVMESCMQDGFKPQSGFGGEGIVQLDEEDGALAEFLELIYRDEKYCGYKDIVFIVNDFFKLKVTAAVAEAHQPKRDCKAFARQAAISINNILKKLAGADDVAMMSHVWWLAGRFWYWAITANHDPHFQGTRQEAIDDLAFALPLIDGRMPAEDAITKAHWQDDEGHWREDYNPTGAHGMVASVRLGLEPTDPIILVEFSVHPTYV
jgi:hypothetical protein